MDQSRRALNSWLLIGWRLILGTVPAAEMGDMAGQAGQAHIPGLGEGDMGNYVPSQPYV
jgi:hypothetical protein